MQQLCCKIHSSHSSKNIGKVMNSKGDRNKKPHQNAILALLHLDTQQGFKNIFILQGVRLNVYFYTVRLTSSNFVQNSQNMNDLEVNIPRFMNLKRHFNFCRFSVTNFNIQNFNNFFPLNKLEGTAQPLESLHCTVCIELSYF